MPKDTSNTIELQRAYENFRQEQETFNQRKKHDDYWFILKMFIGGCSILIMIIVLAFSIYVIYNYRSFSDTAVIAGGIGLVTDVVASSASVWKLTLSPNSMSELKPVTSSTISSNEEE